MKSKSTTKLFTRVIIASLCISAISPSAYSRFLTPDSDGSGGCDVSTYECRQAMQQAFTQRMEDRRKDDAARAKAQNESRRMQADLERLNKAAAKIEGMERNKLALENYRCSTDGKSPEEMSSSCVSMSDVELRELQSIAAKLLEQRRIEEIRKYILSLDIGAPVTKEAWVIQETIKKKPAREVTVRINGERLTRKAGEVADDSNFIAYVRAASACTEVDDKGQLVNTSANCQVVRDSLLLGHLQATSALTGLSVSEIRQKMDSNENVMALLGEYLSTLNEIDQAEARADIESTKYLTGYLTMIMPKLNSALRK